MRTNLTPTWTCAGGGGGGDAGTAGVAAAHMTLPGLAGDLTDRRQARIRDILRGTVWTVALPCVRMRVCARAYEYVRVFVCAGGVHVNDFVSVCASVCFENVSIGLSALVIACHPFHLVSTGAGSMFSYVSVHRVDDEVPCGRLEAQES